MSEARKLFRKDNIDATGPWTQPGQWSGWDVAQIAANSMNPNLLYPVARGGIERSIDGVLMFMRHVLSSLRVAPEDFMRRTGCRSSIGRTPYEGAAMRSQRCDSRTSYHPPLPDYPD